MPIVVQRGAGQIDLDELKGHIATLLRLENVGVLLGAGASVRAGGRTVKQLWSGFVDAYRGDADELLRLRFVDAQHVDPDPAIRTVPNVELLGDALEIAARECERDGTDAPKLTLLRQLIGDLKRAVVRAAILDDDWWKEPGRTQLDPRLQDHKSLLQKITAARQPGQSSPWIFTTNYDLCVEWAAEAIDLQVVNGFLGLHNRSFSPQSFDLGLRNTMARGEARFGVYNIYLAKLHGSLSWNERSGEIFERAAPAVWPEVDGFLRGGPEPSHMLVFPRAAKYLQTVGFALGELLRRFSEFLVRPQTALFVSGYGFGDEHLNRILLSALQNPTLQVVVYLPELDLAAIVDNAPAVRALHGLASPRVTLVGGAPEAFFPSFVEHLPDPIVYDAEGQRIRELLRGRAAGAGGGP